MADEATLEEEVETAVDPLEEFQSQLDNPSASAEEPEQDDDGVEESAEVESGEVEATEEVAETHAEGPSFLMKRAALDAGLDATLVAKAKSDEHLELMIEAAGVTRQAYDSDSEAEAEEAPDYDLSLDLPEDEYGPDDPLRKQLASWQGKLSQRFAEHERALGAALSHIQRQLQTEETTAHSKVFGQFDKVLDSFDSAELGKRENMNAAQFATRKAIADKYLALGATPDSSESELETYTEAAIMAFKRDLIEQRNIKQQAATKQRQKVLGGGGSRSVERAMTEDDLLAELDEIRAGKKPFPS